MYYAFSTNVEPDNAVQSISFELVNRVFFILLRRRNIPKDRAILRGNSFHPEEYFLKMFK